MMVLLSEADLRSNDNASRRSAQTERRGRGRAGAGLAWRQNLAGRFRLFRNPI
jgi:hypothetical protein